MDSIDPAFVTDAFSTSGQSTGARASAHPLQTAQQSHGQIHVLGLQRDRRARAADASQARVAHISAGRLAVFGWRIPSMNQYGTLFEQAAA